MNIANRKNYILSIKYIFKWSTIAIISGIIGTAVIHSFTFLLHHIHTLLRNFGYPLPIYTILGAGLVGTTIYKIQIHSAGEGIPSYLRGVLKKSGKLNKSVTFFKFWAALITLGTFGNGGIVGPLGRVSSGITSYIGQKIKRLGFNDHDVRTASICGLSSSVGAIFHSSIGGGIFAVEIIQKDKMNYNDLFPAILSSATSVFFAKVLGFKSFYYINAVNKFMDINRFAWLILFAIFVGFVSGFYTNFYAFISKIFKRREGNMLLKVLIGSAIAAIITWLINPELMGTSQTFFNSVFQTNFDKTEMYGNISHEFNMFWLLLIICIVKGFANCITVGSGMSAGFTGPVALIGLLLGVAMSLLLNIEIGSPTYYAFLAAGFASMLAGSMNIPLAAAVITIEFFGLQYSWPAGIAAIIGFQINNHATIYDLTLDNMSKYNY